MAKKLSELSLSELYIMKRKIAEEISIKEFAFDEEEERRRKQK